MNFRNLLRNDCFWKGFQNQVIVVSNYIMWIRTKQNNQLVFFSRRLNVGNLSLFDEFQPANFTEKKSLTQPLYTYKYEKTSFYIAILGGLITDPKF